MESFVTLGLCVKHFRFFSFKDQEATFIKLRMETDLDR